MFQAKFLVVLIVRNSDTAILPSRSSL